MSNIKTPSPVVSYVRNLLEDDRDVTVYLFNDVSFLMNTTRPISEDLVRYRASSKALKRELKALKDDGGNKGAVISVKIGQDYLAEGIVNEMSPKQFQALRRRETQYREIFDWIEADDWLDEVVPPE
jgi:hypothetical protein